jgi:hypothetical protein
MFRITHQAWGLGRARTGVGELERRRETAREVGKRVKRILAVVLECRT